MLGIDLDGEITLKTASLRFFEPNERHVSRYSSCDVLLLVYVIAVNVPSWLGNTPHTRDSLLPRSIVSMLTSFPLNAGVAEQKPAA